MKNNSERLAEAILKDYELLKSEIDGHKNEEWKNSSSYWTKILTNIMHIRSNKRTLLKRKQCPEFPIASDYSLFAKKNKDERRKLLKAFVPGGEYIKPQRKIEFLINAFDFVLANGFENQFNENLDKKTILDNLMQIDGIGCKLARNILMDLYHPVFRNGSIPIDNNWGKIGKFLGYKWSNSTRHENGIILWREQYISRDMIKEDWEFDRLIYFALNDKNSEVYKLIANSQA